MLEPCQDCGALYPPYEGPTHRYIGASAACWALYSAVNAGFPPDAALLAGSHVPDTTSDTPEPARDLGVLLPDAYALQHHGGRSPQAIQSVAVHLLTLHAAMAHGVDPNDALWVRRRALRTRGEFVRLEPPPRGTAMTVRHLFPGGGVGDPISVGRYVASVYAAWARTHSGIVEPWYERFVVAG